MLGLYTFESPNTISRLTNQRVVADTSYVIAVNTPQDDWTAVATPFHINAVINGVVFVINLTARQEFVHKIRGGLLAEKFIDLATHNTALRQAYATELNASQSIRDAGLVAMPAGLSALIRRRPDPLFKWHVREGNMTTLLQGVTFDIWAEAEQYLRDSYFSYEGGSGSLSWSDFGELVSSTGLAPTDAMIANFALGSGASAIISTDSDYIQIAARIDVYLPKALAQRCAIYNALID